jgi:predicted acetyltransferase
VVAAVSGRGVLPLIKVPSKVKINAEFYVDCVLRPILENHVPRLYSGEIQKVFFPHDKATSHTSSKTHDYLIDLKSKIGINFISNDEVPVKSPDASLCDFWAFSRLKQELFNAEARTIPGLWKVCNRIWNQITLKEVTSAMNSWKRQCRLISLSDGNHIEHKRYLHKKRVRL